MANVLEGLVAKGRRVNHIREQREVAFGLADCLSSNFQGKRQFAHVASILW